MASLGMLFLKSNPKRASSTFFSKELIYDYLTNQLDESERKQIEENLESNASLQSEMKGIQSAKNFLSSLRHFEISVTVSERVDGLSEAPVKISSRFNLSQAPEGVRQALFALGFVSFVLVVLLVVPWHKFKYLRVDSASQDILTLDRNRGKSHAELAEVEKNEKPLFQDEPELVSINSNVTSKISVVEGAPSEEVNKNDLNRTSINSMTDTSEKESINLKDSVKNLESDSSTKHMEVSADMEPSPSSEVSTLGYLYRGQMKITNLEVNGDRLTKKIKELGGRKAGEVDLGWKKGRRTLYYHFTIPEAKYEELKNSLSLYGKPQITKEKHPRLMPEGIIRLILTIDEEKQ